MSNFLAIATVTATLRRTLQDSMVAEGLSSAGVTTVRPNAAGAGAPAVGINIYLYQVTPNGSWRNADLPSRREDGQMAQRPQAALDLHYLLSFYGDEAKFEPQRLLGSAVRTLHAQPTLTRRMIRDTVNDPTFGVAASDLADQVELVRLTPLSLSLEDLSKLWSVFFQTPYALSVAYQACVVLIEGRGLPQAALPVRKPKLTIMPFRQPVIESVMSRAPGKPVVADQPILPGYTLVLAGKQLRGDVTRVRVGGVTVQPQEASDTQIAVLLSSPTFPPDSLRAGVQAAQVVHELTLGTPGDPHRGFESNVAPFVLRPVVTAPTAAAGATPGSPVVTMQLIPAIGRAQRLVLLLNETSGAAPAAYSFVAPPRSADAAAIAVSTSGVKAGKYFVRLQVDGAESVVDLDPGPTFGPAVDLDPASPTFGQTVTIP